MLLLHLKALTLIYVASVEIVRKEFSKEQKSAQKLIFSVPDPNYHVRCTFEVCNGLIHCLLPYEYLITLKWLTLPFLGVFCFLMQLPSVKADKSPLVKIMSPR